MLAGFPEPKVNHTIRDEYGVVTADGIYKDPLDTLNRVRKVLRSRGVVDVPAHPRRGWHAHFPGR